MVNWLEENQHIAEVKAEKHIYETYEEMQAILKKLLSGYKTIALDFSPENGIPVIDVIPHGFYMMVQAVNPKAKLLSSADLTQYLSSTWNKAQYASHKKAALLLTEIVQKTLVEMKRLTKNKKPFTDYDIEQFILGEYKKNNLVTEPHLAVVATDARDAGIQYVKNNIAKEIKGYEVDREVRKYIASKGYGRYFVHRTGHSIDSQDHGNGANIDDYETHDLRALLPHTGFSIEPGIYLKEFGVRSEINMYITEDKKTAVTTPPQTELFIV